MYPVDECRMGLKTGKNILCRMCNIGKTVKLIEETQGEKGINSTLAFATVSTGTGYTTVVEMLYVLEIPFMSNATYQEHHESVADIIEETAWRKQAKKRLK
ncbi:hypothetical protein JTB14_037246 [Gonioctena quinquepunctata]|nr:hypothetical protein JTB14_037246 [Gonioctena quinquepunctata]